MVLPICGSRDKKLCGGESFAKCRFHLQISRSCGGWGEEPQSYRAGPGVDKLLPMPFWVRSLPGYHPAARAPDSPCPAGHPPDELRQYWRGPRPQVSFLLSPGGDAVLSCAGPKASQRHLASVSQPKVKTLNITHIKS